MSHSSSGFICTRSLASVVTRTILSDRCAIFVYLSTYSRSGAYSFVVIAQFVLFFSLGSSYRSLMLEIGTGLELLKIYFGPGGKQPFTNVAMNKVPSRTPTATLRTTPKILLL